MRRRAHPSKASGDPAGTQRKPKDTAWTGQLVYFRCPVETLGALANPGVADDEACAYLRASLNFELLHR